MSERENFYRLVGHSFDEVSQEDWDLIAPFLNLMPVDRIGAALNVPDWKVAIVDYEIHHPQQGNAPF